MSYLLANNRCRDNGHTYLGDSGQVTGELLEGMPVAQWRYLDNAGDRRLAGMAYPGGAGARALRSDAYRILGIAEGDWVRLYRYDAKDRLLLAADVSRAQELGRLDRVRATRGVLYRYDAADNLLQGRTLPTQINALNQLRRWAGEDLVHDANGNLVTDGRWRYRYDAENRLVAMQAQDASEVEYRFGYDGLGRRVSESGNDSLRSIRWCGDSICRLRSSGGSLTYPYPQGEWRGGRRLYEERDHLGGVRAVRDLDRGGIVGQFDYAPYGETRQRSGTVLPERGFAGMFRHADSGLYLTHYRAYSPIHGRWLSRDPIHEAGGINLYAYVNGNPISNVDPLGLEWQFSQSTGQWSYVDDQTGAVTSVGRGYSGTGEGRNNSAMQDVSNVGPTPQTPMT